MADAGKKQAKSFSLTDAELARLEARAKKHGFPDKNKYLLALVDVDERLELTTFWDRESQRLGLVPTGELHAAESPATYGGGSLSDADIQKIARRLVDLSRQVEKEPREHPPDQASQGHPPAPQVKQAI